MSTFSTSSRQKRLKTLSFYTFDFEMCFAPQRRALFRHFFDIWTSKSGPRPSIFNTFDFEMCFAPQRRALFRPLNFQKWSEAGVFCTFWLGNVLRATTACTFSTSQLQKVVRDRQFLTLLTWKCASRHNGVHFFDIATSKSGPRMVCFVHFDLEMCFAPQRRALFRHRNFKKWSENGVFCTFWLGNVLRATTACTFSSLIWPAGSAPAALASLLFDPPEPQIIGKTQWIATFSVSRHSYLFAHLHLLSSDLFSSDSSHLCFSTVHIVGSFTSKLPSTRGYLYGFSHPKNHPAIGEAPWPHDYGNLHMFSLSHEIRYGSLPSSLSIGPLGHWTTRQRPACSLGQGIDLESIWTTAGIATVALSYRDPTFGYAPDIWIWAKVRSPKWAGLLLQWPTDSSFKLRRITLARELLLFIKPNLKQAILSQHHHPQNSRAYPTTQQLLKLGRPC